MTRPGLLAVVTGTGTGVGKTWLSCEILRRSRARGLAVSARKPVQSMDPGSPDSDADLLADASGEEAHRVCQPDRSFPVAMAPPMAASSLGRAPFSVGELAEGMDWEEGVDLGLVEGAGGCCSPLACDGDSRDLIDLLEPDAVILVTHAGLGVIHDVRAALSALGIERGSPGVPAGGGTSSGGKRLLVYMNHFREAATTSASRAWLEREEGLCVFHDPGAVAEELIGSPRSARR